MSKPRPIYKPGITRSPEDNAKWKSRMKNLQAEWQAALPAGSPMKWHPKRNHAQMRIQCSIGKEGFNELFQLTHDPVRTADLGGSPRPVTGHLGLDRIPTRRVRSGPWGRLTTGAFSGRSPA